MPRFFKQLPHPAAVGDHIWAEGQDAVHIRAALRKTVGDRVTVCDGCGNDYETVIRSVRDAVELEVLSVCRSESEPTVQVTLYQGYPKGDKLEWIIQKAVELGVTRIVPVVTSRSIAKPADKAEKKRERWQKIADEAAGQSGRGILPTVDLPLSFSEAVERMQGEKLLVLYEAGGDPLSRHLTPADSAVSLFIGPEGGISPEEMGRLTAIGGVPITLGKRILRCETAPLATLAAVMCLTENLQ